MQQHEVVEDQFADFLGSENLFCPSSVAHTWDSGDISSFNTLISGQ